MNEYLVALFFGAAIVVVFAWDQFNRPSYEASRELTRLIELVTPARMRKRTVYWRAYMSYAVILLLIYLTLCAYGMLLGPTLGLQIPGYTEADRAEVGASELPVAATADASGYDPDAIEALPQVLDGKAGNDQGFRTDPTVPLFISLIIVGLAPSVPILVRIEEKIRFAAHRLSGIPTRLISGSRQLRMKSLRLGQAGDGLMIPPQDWRRLKHYVDQAQLHLDDPEAFREDVAKIIAFRAWVLQEKLPLANHATRDSLSEIEAGIAKGIDRVIFTLDTLTAFEGASVAQTANGGHEQARLAWEAAAREADQSCGDLCMLTMLYLEHGVLPTEDDAERLGWGVEPDATDADVSRQRLLAERILMRHLGDAERWVDRENLSMVLWARATAVTLCVALVWGLLIGSDTAAENTASLAGENRLVLGLLFLMSAALTYALALLVAISWRQSAYQNGAWRNVFVDNWVRWAPQMLTVFLMSGFAAVVCVVGYSIYATIGAVGFQLVLDNWGGVLRYAVEYNAPGALLGPVLATLVILIVDAWRAGARGAAWMARLPWIAGGVMFAAGVATRLLTSQVGLGAQGKTLDLVLRASWDPALSAGALAGLIGLAVGYFVRGTLVYEFSRAKDEGPTPAAAPSAQGVA